MEASATIPFWGPPTSAVNFCEEDYIVTRFVAEFFNTLTSLAYIVYGAHGILRYKRQNIGVFAAANLSYWGLIGVGIFSGLYHLSLKYHTQMGKSPQIPIHVHRVLMPFTADELSMHLAIGTVLHQVFTFQEPPNIQRRNTAIILGVLVPFVIYHCVTDEFVLHVLLFFIMSWIVAFRTRKIIAMRIKEKRDRDKIRSLVTFATIVALSSYGIWNIDVHFCPQITALKKKLGFPFDILLELHGWWHIGTSVSSYTFMAIIEFLLSPDATQSHGVGFAWPAKAVLLELAPGKMNGAANGHVHANSEDHKSR